MAPVIAGERLALPGSRGSRSVKRLCLDRGISLRQRDRLPAVYVGGRLAAVWRLGVDMEFLPEASPAGLFKSERTKREGIHEKRDGAGPFQGPGDGGAAQTPHRGSWAARSMNGLREKIRCSWGF